MCLIIQNKDSENELEHMKQQAYSVVGLWVHITIISLR
jgi:hypothetical protein